MSEPRKETVYAKRVFTDDELKEFASELARKNKEKTAVAEEKKAANSSFKSRIDILDARISILSSNITNGYKFENIECELELDFDTKERKYINPDTREIVKTEPMRPDDFQTDAFEDKDES